MAFPIETLDLLLDDVALGDEGGGEALGLFRSSIRREGLAFQLFDFGGRPPLVHLLKDELGVLLRLPALDLRLSSGGLGVGVPIHKLQSLLFFALVVLRALKLLLEVLHLLLCREVGGLGLQAFSLELQPHLFLLLHELCRLALRGLSSLLGIFELLPGGPCRFLELLSLPS